MDLLLSLLCVLAGIGGYEAVEEVTFGILSTLTGVSWGCCNRLHVSNCISSDCL
jgi:hypothetical protein